MNVLILGSTGFVGKNLLARLQKQTFYKVVGVSRATGTDILNYEQIAQCIRSVKPDIIFNVASHTASQYIWPGRFL